MIKTTEEQNRLSNDLDTLEINQILNIINNVSGVGGMIIYLFKIMRINYE